MCIRMGITIFKMFIWELYCQIHGRKAHFTVPLTGLRKTKFPTVYGTIYTSPNEHFEYSYPQSITNFQVMNSWGTSGPDRQIYLRSDMSCLVEEPTIRREICVEKSLLGPDISIVKCSVLIDQSKSGIGKPCTHNRYTIYCTVMIFCVQCGNHH